MDFLKKLGIEGVNAGTSTGRNYLESKNQITSYTPVDGKTIANVTTTTKEQYEEVVQASQEAFKVWREMPAPQRGEIVRQIGDKLREFKEPLGKLVTYEMGKIYQEGLGEVQEMIDICDFAVGLSRQLHGLTMHSERPGHRMYEQYHSLGIVGIISAFNFPVAVWAWNTALAWICGDVCVWKPSEKTPLTAIACQKILTKVFEDNDVPEGVSVSDFVDHIDYMVELIGIDHVGISSDFDGGGGIEGWRDASETANVTFELLNRGYSEAEIAQIWSGNLLRVLDQVEVVAAQLQAKK